MSLLLAAAVSALQAAPGTAVSASDVGPMPCAPGEIRPRTGAASPKHAPGPNVLAAEREVRALRAVAERFRRSADEAVLSAYRRERETIRRSFLARLEPLEENERARRAEALAEFRAHLRARPEAQGSADVRFRLAELEFEDATDRYAVAMRAWEAAAAAVESEAVRSRPGTRPVAALPPPPLPDYTAAIEAYRDLLARHPGFARRDGALYMIAYCLGEMGNGRGARDAFEQLARAVPDSSYAAEAWLRVGEYHFERAELPAAIAAYTKAAEHREAVFFDKALYKLAWSHYRQASPRNPHAWSAAADVFTRLVDEAPASELRAEALQYLAVIYADHGGLPAVKAAISGRPWAHEVVQALAMIWFEQGNWNDAAETYDLALQIRPDADDAPSWLDRRAAALAKAGRDREAAEERERLHHRYGPASVWADARRERESLLARARAMTEPALLSAAVWRHRQAQSTGEESDYARAADLYDEYLETYPGHAAAYDLAFYRGECLFFAGRFARAADAYAMVLEFGDDNRWHAEAAFSRVKALEALAGPPLPSGSEPAFDAATQPIPALHRQLAEAAERFTCIAPDDWRVPETLLRAAQVYYATRRFASARERAEAVVTAAPREDLAADAATLIVDTWRLERNWAEVESSARRLAAVAPGRLPAVRESTRQSLERVALEAGYKLAEEQAARGEHEVAAASFLALAARAPRWDSAGTALFAAGEQYEAAGLSSQAARAFGTVAAEHAASSLARPAAFRRARNLERVLEVETAAKAYEEYAASFRFHADAQAATWNAAVLWEAAGRFDRAAAAYERYLAGWKDAEDRLEARFRFAEASLRAGRHAAAVRAFDELAADPSVAPPRTVEALGGLARAQRARKSASEVETARAVEEQQFLRKAGTSTPESARAAARVGLDAADELRATFEKAPLTRNLPKIEDSIRAKADLLREAQDAYLAVATLGDADAATEALHRIGGMYVALAEAVRAYRLPSAAKDEYGPVLARFAVELDGRALRALESNVAAADAARIATVWTERSRTALAILAPDRHPPRRTIELPPAGNPPVWAIPAMLDPPAVLVASADPAGGAQAPSAPARALADGLRLFARSRAQADHAGLIEAERTIASAVTAAADHPDRALRGIAWFDLGVAREALGDDAGAAVAWRTARDTKLEDATRPTPWRERATAGLVAVLARSGDTDEAIRIARDWLRTRPADVAVRVNLAGALAANDDAPAALAMALEALAGDARFAPARHAAVATALAARRHDLALFAARQAVHLAPDDPEAVRLLARALRTAPVDRIHGRARGRQLLVEAAARFSGHTGIAFDAGRAILEDGDPAGAVPLLEAAASRSTRPDTWLALAAARHRAGRAVEAAQAAETAVALRPGEPATLRALGLARSDAADWNGAAQAFREYLRVTEGRRAADDPVVEWLREVRVREEAANPPPPPPPRTEDP